MNEEKPSDETEDQLSRENPAQGPRGIRGLTGERGIAGPSINTQVRLAFVSVTFVFFVTLFGFMWIVNDVREVSNDNLKLVEQNARLIKENEKRIHEIQENRIQSCVKTYSGIQEVFRPFFVPKAHRTAEQQANIEKFNSTIARLERNCVKSIK